MKKAEENGGDAIESSELVTLVQKVKKPAKSQTFIKIYQDETTVTRTFMARVKKQDVKYFRMNGQTTPSSLFDTDPRLTQE